MHVVLARLRNHAIHLHIVELALHWLKLRPTDAHQRRVQVARHQLRPDCVHVLQAGRRVVAQLACHRQIWLAIHDQLRRIPLLLQVGNAGRDLCNDSCIRCRDGCVLGSPGSLLCRAGYGQG